MADIRTWALTPENAPAELARQLTHSLLNEGVVDVAGGSYRVLEDTGANMFVRVGSGTAGDRAVVKGDTSARQGSYIFQHQEATVQLPIAAADPSNPRIDLVVARVFDDEADSSGSSFTDVEVLTGTPAGSPVPPAVPDSAIALAEVEVEANATAITNTDITDRRQEAVLRSEVVPVPEPEPLDVAEVTAGTEAVLTLTVPAGVPVVRILGISRCDDTGANTRGIRLRVNNDATANIYARHIVTWTDSGATPGVVNNAGDFCEVGTTMTDAPGQPGRFAELTLDITKTGAGSHKMMISHSYASRVAGTSILQFAAHRYASTDAISTIQLFPSVGEWMAGTRFILVRG